MKYIGQFCIIALFSLLGEILHALIPFPIPAAIYGLVLLFLALLLGILKPEQVQDTCDFLVVLLSLLFVAPLVGLADNISVLASNALPIALILVFGTAATFAVSGGTVQLLLNAKKRRQAK